MWCRGRFPLRPCCRLQATSKPSTSSSGRLRQQMPGSAPECSNAVCEGLRIDEACTADADGRGPLRQGATRTGAAAAGRSWKYGFRNQGIVGIKFVERMRTPLGAPIVGICFSPTSTRRRYPRWSRPKAHRQRHLRFAHTTLPFNGYADQVASLYSGWTCGEFLSQVSLVEALISSRASRRPCGSRGRLAFGVSLGAIRQTHFAHHGTWH